MIHVTGRLDADGIAPLHLSDWSQAGLSADLKTLGNDGNALVEL
jgi:hypothetical protein